MDDAAGVPLGGVRRYFEEKFAVHGATYKGVDYGSPDRQDICFAQLVKICDDPSREFSLIDFGCGYGAIVDFLVKRGFHFAYRGYDLSERILEGARALHGRRKNCSFVGRESELEPADYAIAGGVFNIKLDAGDEAWTRYVLDALDRLWSLSTRGMAFNILTSFSDPERMRPDLYYADPCLFFDHCKRRFSRNVALLHDYGAYEFTMLVRGEGRLRPRA